MNEAPATIQRSYRIRVYPTAAQRAQLARWFGAARWVWNHALERRSKAYRRRGESVTGIDVSRSITALKRTRRYGWLGEIPASRRTPDCGKSGGLRAYAGRRVYRAEHGQADR